MTHVLILQGPPKSGKDTIANGLVAKLAEAGYKTKHTKSSLPLLAFGKVLFEQTDWEYLKNAEFTLHIARKYTPKDKPLKVNLGDGRDVLIRIAHAIRKECGEGILGELAATHLRACHVHVFTGCADTAEVASLIDNAPTVKNFTLVHINRESVGSEFKDGRSYTAQDVVPYATKRSVADYQLQTVRLPNPEGAPDKAIQALYDFAIDIRNIKY